MASERIVIIGGGFTGLVAARELARGAPGASITLIERTPVLGGLAAGFPMCGTSLEKTYHYLFLTDSEMLSLARELRVDDRVIWGDSTIGVYLGGRIHPFTTPLDLLRFSPCSPLGRLRLGAAVLYLQRKKDWRKLAPQTGRTWLARACGASAMQTVWEPLLRGKFDRHHDQVSMAWLWARIHSRMNSRAQGREKLGYFRGGFAVVIRRLEEELRRANVQVRLGAGVERLEWNGDRGTVRVSGEALPFDRCLFTGPSPGLARLLPDGSVAPDYRRKLESVGYLGAVCLIFSSDQSIASQSWLNIHESGAPFLLFIQHSLLVGADLYQGRHVYYLGCYVPPESPVFGQDDEVLTRNWLSYLKRMFPHFDPARIGDLRVFRFAAAQHVVDTAYQSRIPDFRTPVPGLYLANFSQVFPEDRGTNFAVRDGRRVAHLMLDDLKSGERWKGGA